MLHLPTIVSGKEFIKILTLFGYRIVRQRGSHIRLASPSKKSVTVPNHTAIGHGLLQKNFTSCRYNSGSFHKKHNEK